MLPAPPPRRSWARGLRATATTAQQLPYPRDPLHRQRLGKLHAASGASTDTTVELCATLLRIELRPADRCLPIASASDASLHSACPQPCFSFLFAAQSSADLSVHACRARHTHRCVRSADYARIHAASLGVHATAAEQASSEAGSYCVQRATAATSASHAAAYWHDVFP